MKKYQVNKEDKKLVTMRVSVFLSSASFTDSRRFIVFLIINNLFCFKIKTSGGIDENICQLFVD